MSTQHTPRPWKKGKPYLDKSHNMAVEIYHDGCGIARVMTSAAEPGEQEANAALVEAAPDMLFALEGWLGYERCCLVYGITKNCGECNWCVSTAAVKRAKGA